MEFVMSDPATRPRTADILAFRPRAKVPEGMPNDAEAASLAVASAEDPQLRLQRALAALDDALARQKHAVAEWRSTMTQLGAEVDGLGGALAGLTGNLGNLYAHVSVLHSSAKELEAQADRLLVASGEA